MSPRMEELEFRWLGTRVSIRSQCPEFTGLVRRFWALSDGNVPASDPPAELSFSVEVEPSPRFRSPGGVRPLDASCLTLHAYNLFVESLLGRVRDHFVFHATSVSRGGRALVLSGPSTFGKTTLGIHLASRGFRLLADDLTIMDRETSRLLPFSRPLRLRPGTRATLHDGQLGGALAARRGVEGDEWSVDPRAWLPVRHRTARPSMVVIMRPHGDGTGVRRFPFYEVRAVDGEAEVLGSLADLPGVEELARDPAVPNRVRVRVRGAAPLIRWVDARRSRLVYAIKHPSEPPDFGGPPRLEPLGRFQTALELCQELLNRHPGSALSREYAGREARLVADVAERLRGVRCLALFPGLLESTLELLEQAFVDHGDPCESGVDSSAHSKL